MHVQATRRFGRRIDADSGRWRGQRAVGIVGPLRFRLSRRIACYITLGNDRAAGHQSGARQLSAVQIRRPGLPGTRPGGSSTNPSQQLAPGLPPPAATVQPAPQQDSVSPLSPQTSPPAASSGGSARQGSLALSPGGSETNPSAPGGGGKTLADCMGFWEPATHMTKQEWRGACQRTIGRLGR